MLKVENLEETKKEGNTTINMIIYGDSGVGKTTLAASAAELGKVLYIDAESGAKFIPEKYSKNIDILKLENVAVLDEVLKPENIKEYDTIVLDSITEIMKKLLDRIKGSKEKPTIGDWGSVINSMETYFRKFRDLEKNVILVALSSEKEDDGVIIKRPSLSGKNLPADIVGIVDICLYLENTTTGRIAYSQPSTKYYAKDRTSTLPEKIVQEDLTMKFISEKVLRPATMINEEQLKEIYRFVELLKLEEEAVTKMANYGGAQTPEELTETGANKVIEALKVKEGYLVKEEKKEEPKKEKKEEVKDEVKEPTEQDIKVDDSKVK